MIPYFLFLVPYGLLFFVKKFKESTAYLINLSISLFLVVIFFVLKDDRILLGLFSTTFVSIFYYYYNSRRNMLLQKYKDLEDKISKLQVDVTKIKDKYEGFQEEEKFYLSIFEIFDKLQTIKDIDEFDQYIEMIVQHISGSGEYGIKIVDNKKDAMLKENNVNLEHLNKLKCFSKEYDKVKVHLCFNKGFKLIRADYSLVIEIVLLMILKFYLFNLYDKFSQTDYLTGLYKKRVLMEKLVELSNRAARKNIPYTIAFFDIDDFKLVNDNYGHIVGDNFLVEFSKKLLKLRDKGYIIGRFGGEEFVVLMLGVNKKAAIDDMEEIREKIAELDFSNIGILHKVTVSCGIASFPIDGKMPYELLKVSDDNLYKAKNSGKNRIVF
ncbi:GGDEF domain-containing protein [bacterium]|nr:GGDEF domain-containing protein [bacterium]